MFRHFWSIVTIVMCSGGFTGYSLIRVASLADAADEAVIAAQDGAENHKAPPRA
ncbi:hypothetical protein [Variovorax ginsengisoli]|uniref:Uncharacterized protein n=1 Tax=Variovorax ginsengisoli TaxID=363844 RepID=A0ABT9SBV9_9BURK|nr:hypothetical protein [Variovorax ginsengisoli]MDP9901838.1 hypothetical protein [Variovorax ginsengisoli]